MGEKNSFCIPKLICFFLLLISAAVTSDLPPVPHPWPLQFHSVLVMNSTEGLQIADLWYDYPNGGNLMIFQNQLGPKEYHLEWNNGTVFYYSLETEKFCSSKQVEVGILRPNWLDGAQYLGQVKKDGFLCNVWNKVDTVWYYEDVATKAPVYWAFDTGTEGHFMTYSVGKVLEEPKWQAPFYCFEEAMEQKKSAVQSKATLSLMGETRDFPWCSKKLLIVK